MTIFDDPLVHESTSDLSTPDELAERPEVAVARPSPWRRLAPEFTVAVAALLTNLWSLSINGWGNAYYAAAVRSMTQSWSNFFFASYDPGGWVTVDKPPLAFWAPALSARIFGFSSWSILVPSAIAGATAVWLLTITVRRVWGRTAGLVAGAALATMPTAVAVSRSNNPDVWLVLGVVAAAWALERAIATDKMRWLVWLGVFVGVGFLAKLGAAVIVVPAMWCAYLVTAKGSWRRRLVGLSIATLAAAAVSLIWIGSVALIPASSRPYIGGSTDGTAWQLVTGYNGLGRLTGSGTGAGPGGGGFPGRGAAAGAVPGGFGGSSGVNSFGGSPGIGRLFNAGMGDQVMWLVAPAVAAAFGATWLLLRRRLRRNEIGSLVAWAGWAATTFVAFSYASGIYHNYYVSQLAPAIAALVGIGASLVLRSNRTGRVIAALSLLGSAAIQLLFLRRIDALTGLRVIVPVAVVIAAIVLLVQTRSAPTRRAALIGVAIAAAAAMIAPTAWSVSSLGRQMSGSFPEARPISLESNPTGAQGSGGGGRAGGFAGGGTVPGGAGIDNAQLSWLRSQRTTEQWLVAVDSSMQASDAIINGDSVMAIGGFGGSDQTMTNARLAELVRHGELRFVSTGSGFGRFGASSSISSTVTSVCANVQASNWGGSGDSTLYDCAGQSDAIAAAADQTKVSPQGGGESTAVPGNPNGAADFQAIQECMAAKGFDLSNGPPSQDAETLAALTECGLDPQAVGAAGPPVGAQP